MKRQLESPLRLGGSDAVGALLSGPIFPALHRIIGWPSTLSVSDGHASVNLPLGAQSDTFRSWAVTRRTSLCAGDM